MHIVFVTRELATATNTSGGLASFTANMARIFAHHGHRVSIVVAATKEERIIFDERIDVRTTYIEMKKWRGMDNCSKIISYICKDSQDEIRRMLIGIYKSKQVKKVIEEINSKEKIDIVHYCYPGALNMRAKKSTPYIVRISGFLNILNGGASVPKGSIMYNDNPLSLRDRLDEYALKKARYVVSPSNLLADICQNNIGIEPNVIESPFVFQKQDWNYEVYIDLCQGKKYVLHYGSLRNSKGIYVVAELAERLLQKHPDLYLVLAGNNGKLLDEYGKEMEASELVKRDSGKYAERVIYAGRLVREQLYPLVQNAELCLLPSRIENLSNACIEAMAMGKIVVATNGASYEQLIEDGVNGFLRERDNSDSFLEGIEKVLSLDEKEKEVISENAKKTVERLNPDNIYQQYLNYYQKVIEEW